MSGWHIDFQTRETAIRPIDPPAPRAGPGVEGHTPIALPLPSRWRPSMPLGWDWAAPLWHDGLPISGLMIAFPRSWRPSNANSHPWDRAHYSPISAYCHQQVTRSWRALASEFWRGESSPPPGHLPYAESRAEIVSALGELVMRVRALGTDGNAPLLACQVITQPVDHISMRALGILAGVQYLEPLPPYRAACSGALVGCNAIHTPTAAISPTRSAGRQDSLQRIEFQIREVLCAACQVAIDRARSWGSDASQSERMRAIVAPAAGKPLPGACVPDDLPFSAAYASSKTFENSWTWEGAEIAG